MHIDAICIHVKPTETAFLIRRSGEPSIACCQACKDKMLAGQTIEIQAVDLEVPDNGKPPESIVRLKNPGTIN